MPNADGGFRRMMNKKRMVNLNRLVAFVSRIVRSVTRPIFETIFLQVVRAPTCPGSAVFLFRSRESVQKHSHLVGDSTRVWPFIVPKQIVTPLGQTLRSSLRDTNF